MKTKLFLPIFFITFMLPLLFCGCNYGGDDDDYIPIYQDAIYIMDEDGSNKQKVIDVDNCDNVQFIPNSNKLLYIADNSLYTVNEDGSDNMKISGELNVRRDLPAISDDEEKIAFAVYYDSRDYIYDLYMTEPTGNELSNLTNSANISEKEATFIQYQNQEFLLYVTYFNMNETNFSTLCIMDIINYHIDTLYVEEIESSSFYGGFSYPIYINNQDKLFSSFGEWEENLIMYNQLFNGIKETIFTGSFLNPIERSFTENKIFFNPAQIHCYNYENDEIYSLIKGYRYYCSPISNILVYCSSISSNDGDIFTMQSDGANNTKIIDEGFAPRFSLNGDKIVYVGKYVTNPKRNLLTN